MRQPKWRLLRTFGAWLNKVFTCEKRPPSGDNMPSAKAVLLPPLPGSLKQKYTRPLSAKFSSNATSSKPPCPPTSIFGKPVTGAEIRPCASTTRKSPLRSLIKKRPSGRKAKPQGWFRPVATVCQRHCCAASCGWARVVVVKTVCTAPADAVCGAASARPSETFSAQAAALKANSTGNAKRAGANGCFSILMAALLFVWSNPPLLSWPSLMQALRLNSSLAHFLFQWFCISLQTAFYILYI